MNAGRGLRAPSAAALAVLGLTFASSCNKLERFDTPPGEAFCGQISLGSAYREGLSPRVQARVRIAADKLETVESPGTVSTYDAGESGAAQRLVDEAALRPIGPLAHDALGDLEFGDGRERNLVFASTPVDPDAESLFAVVSFRSDDRVELRLLRAGREGDVPAGRRPVFGLFVLERQQGDCGF